MPEPDVAGAVIAVAHPLGVAHAPTSGVCFHSVYLIARSSRAQTLVEVLLTGPSLMRRR